jgi:hypothetical protein
MVESDGNGRDGTANCRGRGIQDFGTRILLDTGDSAWVSTCLAGATETVGTC